MSMQGLQAIKASLKNKNQNRSAEKRYKWTGPVKYQGVDIHPAHHPNTVISTILNTNKFTQMTGVAVIAPPGHGKTTMAECLIHHIHTKRPEFLIKWAGAYEFQHQKQFYTNLPKKPHIIVFDDITGALEQMSDKDVGACFEALTTVRHILGLGNPVIIFALFHYSKKLEKAFRAQFGYKIFLGLGDEEKTNLDQMVEKNSNSFKKLKMFARIYQTMFETGKFTLNVNQTTKNTFETDKPLRCACAVTLTQAHFLVYAKENCLKCAKYKVEKKVPYQQILEEIKGHYGQAGLQALRLELFHKGYYDAIPNKLALAWDFTRRTFEKFGTDYEGLKNELFKISKQRKRNRLYRKRKEEDEMFLHFEENATETKLEIQTTPEENNIQKAVDMMFNGLATSEDSDNHG